MVQRGKDLRLALEARQAVRIAGEEFRQGLQGDVAIEPRIPRAIHLAHSARADEGGDLVDAESGAGRERHREMAVDYTVVAPPMTATCGCRVDTCNRA